MGLIVELEHGFHAAAANVASDEKMMATKIATAHLSNSPKIVTGSWNLKKDGLILVKKGLLITFVSDEKIITRL
jgi:hypothetical protein